LAALSATLFGVREWQKRCALHPELSRKLVHITMGAVALTFPWLFKSSWPVLLLAALSIGLLIAVRSAPMLNRVLGRVVGGVDRSSQGDVYFPVAICVLFLAAHNTPLLYCIPLLVLTLGDATAALAGVRYGLTKYKAADGTKSMEGSVALFTVAFLSIHVPLLLYSSTGRLQCLLIATTLALLVMLLEAIAWGGMDNLWIPIGTLLILHIFMHLSVPALAGRLLVSAGLVLLVLLWRGKTTLQDEALIFGVLTAYCCWTLGGWRWLIFPVIVFLTYPLLAPRTGDSRRRVHTSSSVISISSVGVGLLFLANALHWPHLDLLYVYVISFAVQLSLIGIVRSRQYQGRFSGGFLVITSALKSWLILFSAYTLIDRHPGVLVNALAAFPVIWGTSYAFYLTEKHPDQLRTEHTRLVRHAMFGIFGAALGFCIICVL
jgi:phytol kinase